MNTKGLTDVEAIVVICMLILVIVSAVVIMLLNRQEPKNSLNIDKLYQKIYALEHKIEEPPKSPTSILDWQQYFQKQTEDEIKGKLRYNKYYWEEEGVRYVPKMSFCISTSDVWQATPIPFEFKTQPKCD